MEAGVAVAGCSIRDTLKEEDMNAMDCSGAPGELANKSLPAEVQRRKPSFSSTDDDEHEDDSPSLVPATPSPRSPAIPPQVQPASLESVTPAAIEERLKVYPPALDAIAQFWCAIHNGRAASLSLLSSPRTNECLLDYDRYIRMHLLVQRALLPPWAFALSVERAKRDWNFDKERCQRQGVTKDRWRESIMQIACTRVHALANDPCATLEDLVVRAAAFLQSLVDFVTTFDSSGNRRLRLSTEVAPDAWQTLATPQAAPLLPAAARTAARALREDTERRQRIQARARAARGQTNRAALLAGAVAAGGSPDMDPAILALSNRVTRFTAFGRTP
eukprot:tig00000792_g4159.t1